MRAMFKRIIRAHARRKTAQQIANAIETDLALKKAILIIIPL